MGWKFLNNAYGITTKYSVIHMHTLNIVKEKIKKKCTFLLGLSSKHVLEMCLMKTE